MKEAPLGSKEVLIPVESSTTEPEDSNKFYQMLLKLKAILHSMDKQEYSRSFAMFLVGITHLQPYLASIAGSRFAIKRFGVPEELSPIYVSKFHTSMHTCNILGIIVVNLYMWFFGRKNLRFNPLLSVFTNFLVFINHVCLLISYTVKRHSGHLTLYYWFSMAAAFAYGMNQSLAASVGVEHLAFFTCGLQLAGIEVIIFHSIFLCIVKPFTNINVDFWIVTFQIMIATLISAFSFIQWNSSFGENDLVNLITGQRIEGDPKDKESEDLKTLKLNGAGNGLTTSHSGSNGRKRRSPRDVSEDTENGRQDSSRSDNGGNAKLSRQTSQKPPVNIFISIKIARSPILMSAFCMSFAFAFYPSVSPYELAKLENAHIIDLTVLVSTAIPSLAICIACLLGKGPNKRWQGDNYFWNYFWYLAIPYSLPPIFFLISMHYRDCWFSKFVRYPFVLGLLTFSMMFSYSLMKSVGYSGAGLQEEKRNGTISTFNLLFSFLFLFTFVFWGAGYIKIYNKFEKDLPNWPTSNMFFLKSFIYWAKNSFDAGFVNFKNIATRDLMRDIIQAVET